MSDSSFADVVKHEIITPLLDLCQQLSDEGATAEFAFFSGLLVMLSNPEDEVQVLQAVIELSRCAFLGFTYSPEAAAMIDSLLERAITLSHTMSAGSAQ
ncbi:MAG: hypothetical protein ACFHX7_00950 [Pseudomonadota bacterium]